MNTNLLSKICLEPIDDTYYYGYYGDFKLIIDSKNGFFNATKLCTTGGKHFYHWLQNKQSKEYMNFLKEIRSISNPESHELLYEYKGKRSEIANILRGTYVCEDLIVQIASWVSPVFSYKVTHIINHIFVKESQIKYMKDIKSLKSEITLLEMKNEKYEKLEEDISPKTKDVLKRHMFILTEISDTYPLYAMRCQRKSKAKQIKRLKRKYPNSKVIFERSYDPNAINLFNRVKEKIPYIITFCNKIKLMDGYALENFVKDLDQVANVKL